MVVRLDLYSVVYGLLLGMLLLLHRKQCAFVWPFYITLLVVLLVVQYLSCVGVPPALCWGWWGWDVLEEVDGVFDGVILVVSGFFVVWGSVQWMGCLVGGVFGGLLLVGCGMKLRKN